MSKANNENWEKTGETGIHRHKTLEGKYHVHATAKSPQRDKIVHRRRTLENATLQTAKAKFRKLKRQIRTPEEPQDDTVPSKSITHFAVRWVKTKSESNDWNANTADSARQNLTDHILPRIGHLAPEELSRQHIRSWIEYVESDTYTKAGEEKKYAHDSLRRWWRILKDLVEELYLEGHINRRLLKWTEKQPGPTSDATGRRESRTLAAEQLFKFVDTAWDIVPKWAPEIVTLAYTGMRPSELYGLDWADLHRDASTISILEGFTGELGPPKGGPRRIPMVEPVESALQIQRDRLEEEANLGLEEDIAFPSEVGTRRFPSSLYDPMRQVARAIGTDIKVGPQVIRKTVNTLLGNAGCRREMIKSITGHDTDEMFSHYTEIRLENQASALTTLVRESE
jgi:integrase